MDGLLGGGNQQGGGFGNFMQIALPLGLGVAAAAHPSLARGAAVITNAMNQARQSKRLREYMDIRNKQLAMATESHDWQRKRLEHEEKLWPSQERKARLVGTSGNAGAGVSAIELDEGGGYKTTPITPPFKLTEPGRAVEAAEQQTWEQRLGKTTEAVKQRAEYGDELARIRHQWQRGLPPTPEESVKGLLSIEKLKQHEMDTIRTALGGMVSDEELAPYAKAIEERYKGYQQFYTPTAPKGTIPEPPPPGYIPKPGAPGWYYNPSDPNSKPIRRN